MYNNLIKLINEKRPYLVELTNSLLQEFSTDLKSSQFNTHDSEMNTDNVIEKYFEINKKYQLEVSEFADSLFENPDIVEEKFIGLLKMKLHNIFNEKHSEFQQLLKGHKDYAYISLII